MCLMRLAAYRAIRMSRFTSQSVSSTMISALSTRTKSHSHRATMVPRSCWFYTCFAARTLRLIWEESMSIFWQSLVCSSSRNRALIETRAIYLCSILIARRL